ncbi:MAG: ornithine cyclodeaminase family protein, partial [Methanobacteriota archaeon]
LSLRESKNDITFFKSVGHAIQDLAVASAALARAQDQQIGELVNL